MKNLMIILAIAMALASCNKTNPITETTDYEKYLQTTTNSSLKEVNDQIEFWLSKEENNPTNTYKTQLAALYTSKYKLNGDVQLLHQADDLLEEINEFHKSENPSILRMLASNSITQHEFKKAYDYASIASKYKDNQYASNLILFDACMELGYFIQAEGILNLLENKTSFDYLVRQSKWMDHIGDLDQAVHLMELAKSKVSPNNISLRTWTLSNLGDMYGHQGEVEKSYNAYLDVLALDPDYHYALKGIAYIAYAKDKNLEEARNILNYLSVYHSVPDYYLMLAEIAAYNDQYDLEKELTEKFYTEASKSIYGNMYNKYILEIHLQNENFDQAIMLAENEIKHRATPQTYDLLAWSYYNAGETEKALEIAKKYVENQTFEPVANYHLALFYKVEDRVKSYALLNDTKVSAFELGPLTAEEIEEEMKQI